MHNKTQKGNQDHGLVSPGKTTLKWNSSGELAEEDMARILETLSKPVLTECALSCEIE